MQQLTFVGMADVIVWDILRNMVLTVKCMEESSKHFIDFSLVYVTEASFSNVIKYEGYRRSLEKILG